MTMATETSTFQAPFEAILARTADAARASSRGRAFARFLEQGLPTTRQEDWRSTSVALLAKVAYRAPQGAGAASLASELSLAGHEGARFVLVDGRFEPSLSRLSGLPAGVRLESLAGEAPPETEGGAAAAFEMLHAATNEDGMRLVVPRGVVVEQPIHVLHVVGSGGGPVLSSPRLDIRLEDNAQATVVETHSGRADDCLTVAVTAIDLAPGSFLEHVHAQLQAPGAFHVAPTRVRVDRAATYRSHVFSLGARLSRHDLRVELAGEGASTELYGLSLLGGSQHADHHTLVDHATPHGSSRQVYKGAFAGSARGVFNGVVMVRQDAQKTEAHQQNRNVILSDDALVDSKPQLEILADDVKCTHGATIGQLDEDHLFYLLARGIGPREARQLLTRAFVQEQIERVTDAGIRSDLEARVTARISELETP